MQPDNISPTLQQYDQVIDACKELFTKKTMDYGTAWRVLRPISIVDQIFIKAHRIRTIQEKGEQRIGDSIYSEFVGIVNYGIIGLIQLHMPEGTEEEMEPTKAIDLYMVQTATARQLMQHKNHDYGEAWRLMSQQSFVDLILMKLQRIKQIISNNGQTLVSEGIDANYIDIVNYAIFAIILMNKNAG